MTRTRTTLALSALLAAAGLAASGCSRSQADTAPPPAPPASVAAAPAPAGAADPATLPRLVFFMNPYGRPCQMQDQILEGMAADLRGRAVVVRYRTTLQEDLVRFEQYGIRALPQLVVTDAAGRELRRAPPGIQAPSQVLDLVAR